MAAHDDKEAKRLQRELAKYAAIDDQDINDFIRQALIDRKGQKFIWWLLQVGKYGVNPFAPDAVTMAFQSGEMNVGSQILARVIDVNPLGFAQLQIERKLEDDRRRSSAANIARGDDLLSALTDSGDDDASDDDI